MQRFATLKQLNALYVTANAGSVTEAARLLHVTQPTVTLQIKQLEEATGVTLLEREGRGIKLTEAGRVMTRHAAKIIGQWHEASREIDALITRNNETLRIGAIQNVEYLLPPLIIAFSELDPTSKLDLRIGSHDEILKLLRERSIDMVIMESDTIALDDDLVARPFAEHPTAFIASSQHPLARTQDATLESIIEFGLIVREEGAGARAAIESIFRRHNTPLQFRHELSSNVAIKRMVEANRAIGFISLHACKVELERDLIVPLRGHGLQAQSSTDWCVVTEVGTTPRPMAQQFIDFLLTDARAIADSHFNCKPALSTA